MAKTIRSKGRDYNIRLDEKNKIYILSTGDTL